ncbi:MAG: hypothetical protein HWQ38_24080 [Nostoc sp. NMS7]|uniref:CHC2 zinc finger domain-containing protein n=1 Tax=Nostoc sp. NMS7 TaxID=2815391 RepID=UPI0025E64977|nr:CHC2 zinc finger domain-containing protein [Nostoc sp. NMS7]MBN3949372.1 hypothetical protein [Nostoc sp. NMS7]
MSEALIEKARTVSMTDIHNIVSDYVHLTARGKDYHGDCPFCKQNCTFTIAPKFGMFYCFGCREGGDPIKFLRLMTNKNSEEIVTELSVKYNLA